MNTLTAIDTPKIYVGTYHKYNSGSLNGEWLNLDDYSDSDEFYEACKELHSDEEDPEYMFQDWENIPTAFIGESHISDQFWCYLEWCNDEGEERAEALRIFAENRGHDLTDFEDFKTDFENAYYCYQDGHNPEEDFAYDHANETMEIPARISHWFDYESYARSLFSGDFWQEAGHIFLNC